MSKEQQPLKKPGFNASSAEQKSRFKPEIDYSSVYGQSLGYGSSLEYGLPSQEQALDRKTNPARLSIDWSRVTINPCEERKTEENSTIGMSGDNEEPQIAEAPALPVMGMPERVNEERSEPHAAVLEEQNSIQAKKNIFNYTPLDLQSKELTEGLTKSLNIPINNFNALKLSENTESQLQSDHSISEPQPTIDNALSLESSSKQQSLSTNKPKEQSDQTTELPSQEINSQASPMVVGLHSIVAETTFSSESHSLNDPQAQLFNETKENNKSPISETLAQRSVNAKQLPANEIIELPPNIDPNDRDEIAIFVIMRGDSEISREQARNLVNESKRRPPESGIIITQAQRRPDGRGWYVQVYWFDNRSGRLNRREQPITESNDDRLRWQLTATRFNQQFGANYNSEQIKAIQRLVGANPDGRYGEETARLVYQWQQNNQVSNPDGLVGDITRRAMAAHLRRTNPAAADVLESANKPSETQESTNSLTSVNDNQIPINKPQSVAAPPPIPNLLSPNLGLVVSPANPNDRVADFARFRVPNALQAGEYTVTNHAFIEVSHNGQVIQYQRNERVMLEIGDTIGIPLYYPDDRQSNSSQNPTPAVDNPTPAVSNLAPTTSTQANATQNIDDREYNPIAKEQLLLERARLEALSPEVKYLLGGEDSFQPRNYAQLLRVGRKLQQLPPEEIEYVYKPLVSEIVGDIPRLERSIDVFTNSRATVLAQLKAPNENYSGQAVNNLLFGENPLTSNPSWQQVLKDLIASVLQSPIHAPEILGEVFDFLKEHWVQFVGLTVALIAAQASVAALTGIPEPTFLSKVLAVALQGFILAVYGVGIVVSVEGAIGELMNWWNAASKANGDPEQIASASRSFLRMVGNLILLIISSRQFQAQLKPEKLDRLQAMLNRRQQVSRLPDAYEGTTVDLVPDPDNPNSYIYRLQPNPNAQKLPPSSRPSIDLTNQTPPAPKPSGGGDSGIIPTEPASIPSTSPTTPGLSTPPASTGSIANPEQTLPQQVQQPQVPDTFLPPVTAGGQLTPQTSSSPVTNPNQPIFADPPQPLNLGILPPQTTDGQLVIPSQPSTPQSESIPSQGTQEPIETLLSRELGRVLSPEQIQAAIQGNLERQDIERLVRSAGSWNRVKLNYVSYEGLMRAIIKYRERVVFETVTEVFNSNEEFKQLDTLITDDGQVLGNMTEMVAAGSNDLTSDYDVTFSAGAGNEELEILAVEKFNQLFRERWGLESGVVFDTNVYTSGHMRSAAFKGDGAKLTLVNKLVKELEKIVEEGNPPDAKQRAEINLLVAQVNFLGIEGTPVRLAPLEESNFEVFIQQITKLQVILTQTVKQQYENSKNAYGAGPEFDELATVMSLVHMREFWNQGQPSGANWTRVEERMLGEQVPENVRNLNRTRLDRAGEIHEELVNERRRKIEHLRQENPNLANNEANLEMMANNLLEVEYLHRVSDKLTQIRAAEQSGQAPEQVEALKLELQELQSKALFFANEAYMTAISAEQVVLNQQINLNVKLPTAQYAASINEQTAFVGEQLAHMQGNFGKALWKTAKYVDRILTAINIIYKQTDERVPSQEVMARVNELKPLVAQLLNIKKNGNLTDAQKNEAAANLANGNASVLGADTAGLGRIILDLQTDVNLEMQNYLLNTNNGAQ